MHTTSCEMALSSPDLSGESASVLSRAASFSRVYRSLIAGVLLSIGSIGMRAEAGDPADVSFERPIPSKSGSLVIAGGGDLPPQIRSRFVQLAGGEKAHVVIIPTASKDADDPDKRESFFWPGLKEGVASARIFHTRDRAEADDDEVTRPLDSATAVWFTGGTQRDLALAYRGTRTLQKIRHVLTRGGVVGGTSAGAAIMSETMIEGGKEDPIMGKGLGFLPGTIVDQHFRKRKRMDRLQNATKEYPTHIGVGIDEGTALVVHSSGARVIGASTVSVYHPDGTIREHKDGDEIELLPLTISSLGADAR